MNFYNLPANIHLDQADHFTNQNAMDTLPWSCDFGPDLDRVETCGFYNHESGDIRIVPNEGLTETVGTGPPSESIHVHGNLFKILYFYKCCKTTFVTIMIFW